MTQKKPGKEEENVSYAYEPDMTLSKLIGGASVAAQIFSKEKINACQKMLDGAKDAFFETALPDIDTMSRYMADLESGQPPGKDFCYIISVAASSIKGQAELFGFPLITRICGYIADFCHDHPDSTTLTPKEFSIITKMVEALCLAFNKRIVDDGGQVGKDLLALIDRAVG